MPVFDKNTLFTEISIEKSAEINGGNCYPCYNDYYSSYGGGYCGGGGYASAINQVTTVNVVVHRHRHHHHSRLPVAYGLGGVTSGALVNEYFRRNYEAG